MSKDLSMMAVLHLNEELIDAMANYEHYLSVGDGRLADMWFAILEQICKDIREL